jgi:glycosyltransferase involved in cell wall biosynthesis
MKKRARSIAVAPWRAFRWATRRAVYQLVMTDPTFQEWLSKNSRAKTSAVTAVNKPSAVTEVKANVNPQVLKESSRVLHQKARIAEAIQRMPEPALVPKPALEKTIIPKPDEGRPMVTVVVPLYNEPIFISDTIKSLKHQTFSDFEVIVVDDCSSDGSRASAKTAIGNDKRFRIIQHLKNAGVNGARNTGVRLSKAPFITFLDADDILLPDSLELRVNAILDNLQDHIAGVFSGVAHAAESIRYDYMPANRNWKKPVQTFLSAQAECPFNMHAPLLRTDVLRRLGGFDETMRDGAEDWDMWQRIMRHGYVFIPVEIVTAIYRARTGSRVREMALEHTRLGKRIFDWAYADLPSDEVFLGTPHVFSKGLGEYRKESDFLPRALRFGAMSFMHSKDQFEAFINEFTTDVWEYSKYQIDYKAQIRAGIIRYLAAEPQIIKQLDGNITQATELVYACFEAAARAYEAGHDRTVQVSKDKQVVFFPHGIAQAKLMTSIYDKLVQADISAIIVTTETLTGDQGAERYLTEGGVPFLTYNAYALSKHIMAPSVKVVMRPYSGDIRKVVEGSPVIELNDPWGENDVPEANGPLSAELTLPVHSAVNEISNFIKNKHIPASEINSDQLALPGIIVGVEEKVDHAPDYEKIAAVKDIYRGERCVIIGNGPSINQTDLGKLKDEFTFAVNGIFYKKDEMGFDPTFYVVSDSSVMKENAESIRDYKAKFKFFPTLYRNLHPAEDNVSFYLLNRGFYEHKGSSFCVPRFSMDCARRIYCGQSVTLTNIQLAYYMGFSKVYLIGMDFSYSIPQSAIVQGELITSTEDDPNHFHPLYFGAGKTWKDPHLDRIKIGYQYARDVFLADGREIINATKGGHLEVFRRQDYDSLF